MFRPERAQVEAASAEVVLAIKPLGEVAVGTRGCGREWFGLARVRFRVQVRVRIDLVAKILQRNCSNFSISAETLRSSNESLCPQAA